MKNIKAIRLNLKDKSARARYSQALQSFEREFTYPLGTERFYLQHGSTNGECDYFSFFEQLGRVIYMVLEHEGVIVAAICAVLRQTPKGAAWYLCDFKISKSYRQRQLYRHFMWKFFVPHFLVCSTMYGLNMSPTHHNTLFRHARGIFKYFNLGLEPRYLSQFTREEFAQSALNTPSFWAEHYIVSNGAKKNVVIENKANPAHNKTLPIYHIVNAAQALPSHEKIDIKNVPPGSTLMYLTRDKLNVFANECEVSLIHRQNAGIYLSSAEI